MGCSGTACQRIDTCRFSGGFGTGGAANRVGNRFIIGSASICLDTRTILGTKGCVAWLRVRATGGIAHRLEEGSAANIGNTTASSCRYPKAEW